MNFIYSCFCFLKHNFIFGFTFVASETMGKLSKLNIFQDRKFISSPNINDIIDLGSTIVNRTCRFSNQGLLKLTTVVTLT